MSTRETEPGGRDARRFAIISSHAFSLSNFRGPLIRAIIAKGWKVYALAPDYDDETRAAVVALGAEAVDYSLARTGLNPFADVRDMVRLALLLRRLKVQSMLAYSIKPVIYGTLAGLLAGVPNRFALLAGLGYIFVDETGGDRGWKRRALRAFASRLYGVALRRAKVVFFQNQDDLDEFAAMGLVTQDRARNTRGTGIALGEWTAAPAVTEPITFMLAARLLLDKGVREYISAARRIKASAPQTRFLLLGSLDTNPTAIREEEVLQWVREGLVEWPGHVPIKPWLEQTSVYVLPSYREGVPRSTQEAMAMGRPIITTDTAGCRETVVDGQNGFLVPLRDADAVASAMRRFIDDPSLIQSMGLASRQLVEERFDVQRVNALMIGEMGL